jgi:hypothetical protein
MLVLMLLMMTMSPGALGDLNPTRQGEPEDLRHWSVEQLALTILYGRPGTPMPPWRPFLSPQEAHWLAKSLKQGLGP